MRCLAILAMAAAPLLAQDVAGRVLEDSSGDPLASAELRFHKAGMHELAADLETARDGRFQASGIPAGEYTVDVSKANHVTTTLQMQVPASGLVVRLVRYAVIAGTVRDTEGAPVPGRVLIPGGRTGGSARVAVLTKPTGSDAWKTVRTVALGDGGKYRIFDLPPGQYQVGLWWAGLTVGSGAQMYPDNAHPRIFTVAGGEDYRDVDFLVTPGPSYSVSGKVEGAAPKSQYSVTLGLPDLPALPVGQLWSEPDGSFRLEKIPPGSYDLLVSGPARGYGAFDALLADKPVYGRARIQVIAQNLENVSVPVSPGRSVDVVLKGPKSECPATVRVGLTLLEPWGIMNTGNVQASVDKPQTANDLAPARYSLSATGLGATCYQLNRPEVDLSRDASGPVALQLGVAGQIHGTVRAGTAAATDFAVMLLDSEDADNPTVQLAFPDAQGRFAFTGLRPGRYRIATQLTGAAKARFVADIAHMIEVDVPAGSPTEIDLPVSKGGAQ